MSTGFAIIIAAALIGGGLYGAGHAVAAALVYLADSIREE